MNDFTFYIIQKKIIENFNNINKKIYYTMKTNSNCELLKILKPLIESNDGKFLVSNISHYNKLIKIGVENKFIGCINVFSSELKYILYRKGVRYFVFDSIENFKEFSKYSKIYETTCVFRISTYAYNNKCQHIGLSIEEYKFITKKYFKSKNNYLPSIYLPRNDKNKINTLKKIMKKIPNEPFVIGGYLSPSHENYVSRKKYYNYSKYERIDNCEKTLIDSDWLMIDKWESLHNNSYINFTEVITRLELYLKKYYSKNIQVVYVFGGDNAEFMYCFEDFGGICVERNENKKYNIYQKKKKQINNSFFIDKDSKSLNINSTLIRKKICKKCSDIKLDYILRNEPIVIPKNQISPNLRKTFLDEFIFLLKKILKNQVDINIINLEEQLMFFNNKKIDTNIISLDTYYKGTYNLGVSRLFNISDVQNKPLKIIERPGFKKLKLQIDEIKPGEYILVDDDISTGKTISEIKRLFGGKIRIKKELFLSEFIKDDFYDIIDLRDFIIGTENSGLVVILPNNKIIRVPYLYPYVNLNSRASIPVDKEIMFSRKVWELNKQMYLKYDKEIKLEDMDLSFITLMEYIGFNKETYIYDICEWHINNI